MCTGRLWITLISYIGLNPRVQRFLNVHTIATTNEAAPARKGNVMVTPTYLQRYLDNKSQYKLSYDILTVSST